MKDIIQSKLPYLNKKGFIVIETKDIRIKEYIEPLAHKIIEKIDYDYLWLKENIIVPLKMESKILKNLLILLK